MKIVTAAVIQREDLFFIARRGPGQKLSGYWEFPGGKLEDGETLKQCLERELLEEFGVRAAVGDVLKESYYAYEHGEIVLMAMATNLLDTEFTLTVHDEVRWLPAEEILKLRVAPADIPIAQHLLETKHAD